MSEVKAYFSAETPEGGVIRLEIWPEGFVLWYHGEIVWKSWEEERLEGNLSDYIAAIEPQPTPFMTAISKPKR